MNPARGEAVVTLGGETFTLRPSFEALVEIETRAGCRIVPLALRLAKGDYGPADLEAVLLPCLKAAGGPVPNDLRARIAAEVMPLGRQVVTFLARALAAEPPHPRDGEA